MAGFILISKLSVCLFVMSSSITCLKGHKSLAVLFDLCQCHCLFVVQMSGLVSVVKCSNQCNGLSYA